MLVLIQQLLPSTSDSCVTSGLINGTAYYFKVFAKNNNGVYSPGIFPAGSPATPNVLTVIANGTDPASAIVAPSGTPTFVDAFTFQTATGTDTISAVILSLSNASSTSKIEITNDSGTIVYGSSTNPTGSSFSITLSTNINVTTSLTQYKVRITPKTQSNLPVGSLGTLYPVTAVVTSWTGTNLKSGTDTSGATVTIDNLPPSAVGDSSITQGSTKVTLNYTNPSDSDINNIIVLYSTSPITDTPIDGTTYIAGNTIGASTVGCVDTLLTSSALSSCVVTGLTNGTPYYFKIFVGDTSGNYSISATPTGSPATPNVLTTSVRVSSYRLRNDDGDDVSATYSVGENVGNINNFILGDKVRVRFVISNETATSTTKSYQAEYSTDTCTTWTSIPRKIDTSYQHWRIDPSTYVADNTTTSHSPGMSIPSGKTFVPGRIQTFNKITQPITLLDNQYTEIEFLLRSTSNLLIDTPYCFRLTNSGEASDFIYSQVPQIIPMSRVFRYQGGGGGGGYRVAEIELPAVVATTTVTGGVASSTEATSTPGEVYVPPAAPTSTTTPNKGSSGDGDMGLIPTLTNFAYSTEESMGMVLGVEASGICTDMKNRMFYGKNDATTQGEVSQLQYFLKEKGYFNGEITGNYMKRTEASVKEFQKNNNLIVTGIVGKVTRETMKQQGCVHK